VNRTVSQILPVLACGYENNDTQTLRRGISNAKKALDATRGELTVPHLGTNEPVRQTMIDAGRSNGQKGAIL
jgi:hypothetical protein